MDTFQGGQWAFFWIGCGLAALAVVIIFLTILTTHHDKNPMTYQHDDLWFGVGLACVFLMMGAIVLVIAAFGTNGSRLDDAAAKIDVKRYNPEVVRVQAMSRSGESLQYVNTKHQLCVTTVLEDGNGHWYVVHRSPIQQCVRMP